MLRTKRRSLLLGIKEGGESENRFALELDLRDSAM